MRSHDYVRHDDIKRGQHEARADKAAMAMPALGPQGDEGCQHYDRRAGGVPQGPCVAQDQQRIGKLGTRFEIAERFARIGTMGKEASRERTGQERDQGEPRVQYRGGPATPPRTLAIEFDAARDNAEDAIGHEVTEPQHEPERNEQRSPKAGWLRPSRIHRARSSVAMAMPRVKLAKPMI
jgi:hypothetical protein